LGSTDPSDPDPIPEKHSRSGCRELRPAGTRSTPPRGSAEPSVTLPTDSDSLLLVITQSESHPVELPAYSLWSRIFTWRPGRRIARSIWLWIAAAVSCLTGLLHGVFRYLRRQPWLRTNSNVQAEQQAHYVRTGREDAALVWIDKYGRILDSLPAPPEKGD